MKTLFVALVLLVALFPRVAFSLGFWLSALGVFYIFLFLIHFSRWRTVWIVLGLAVFVYLFMLPVSLFLFGNFSVYHPYSIPLALLFTPFYPLSILLHLAGYGDFFDYFLLWLMDLGESGVKVEFVWYFFAAHLLLSLIAIKSRVAIYALVIASIAVFVYAMLQ
jgi:competence protein ComEC